VSYQYNNANQRTQIGHLYPAYDNKGRLQAVKNSAGVAWMNNIAYNIAGQVTGDTLVTSGTVTNEAFGYDSNRMQLTSQTATKGSTTLMNLTYNYQATAGQNGAGTTAGNSGQLMSISGTINGTTESAAYSYDLWGRLTTSSQTTNAVSAQRRFAYDRWGNRTGMWDATTGGNQIQSVVLQQSGGAPTNRLTSVTTNSVQANYTYDAAGNGTNDGAHSYVYDGENRSVSMDNGAVLCAYDHQNRRIKKSVGGLPTHCVWEGSKVLAEYNGSTGALLVQYLSADSGMIGKVEGGATRYFLSDRLSARLVLDVSGNVVGREAHLPFGEEIAASGEQDKHHFTSYERDTETGIDYAVNRYYHAATARFRSVDPVAHPSPTTEQVTCGNGPAADSSNSHVLNPQNWNRYSYGIGDPVNRTDALGLFTRCIGYFFGWFFLPTQCEPIQFPLADFIPVGGGASQKIYHSYHQNPTSTITGKKKRCRYADFACVNRAAPRLCGGDAEVTVAASDPCPQYIHCIYVTEPSSGPGPGLCHKIICFASTPGDCT
jgi:RHS repeat-associated protein